METLVIESEPLTPRERAVLQQLEFAQEACGLAFDHGRALAERDEALACFRELCKKIEDQPMLGRVL